jgi:hypothetical protein
VGGGRNKKLTGVQQLTQKLKTKTNLTKVMREFL